MSNKLATEKANIQSESIDYAFVEHPELSMLEIHVRGPIHIEGYIGALHELNSKIQTLGYKKLLYRGISTDPTSIKSNDINRIIAATEPFNESFKGGRYAVVVDNKLSYGMFRMWFTLCGENITYEFELFNNLKLAQNWLHQ